MSRLNTLLLDQTAWDLVIDTAGNIATARPAYSLAQDVASAVRLFIGELWYAPGDGIPYFSEILGELPPLSVLTGYVERAALTVPGVVAAQCIIESFVDRAITGQIQFIDEVGAENNVRF